MKLRTYLSVALATALALATAPALGAFNETAQTSFNIADYGAKCDGTTNDNTAINAALTAAATSAAYVANNPVQIIGPREGAHLECVMNSLNLTQFTEGTGSNNQARVTLASLKFLCQGAGNICLDATGATILTFRDVSVRGNPSSAPEICVQVGVAGSGAVSSAWHSFSGLNCTSHFTFAAYYNFGSEANTFIASFISNSQTPSTVGPLGTLGALTAGSSYTNGTYTAVPLTGSVSGKTSALATVVVAAGIVNSVTITYPGRDYNAADSLTTANTNIGGTGTGFAQAVSTVKPYAVVLDGVNHWRASSAFASITAPVDTWLSSTLLTMTGVNIRSAAGGMWIAGFGGPTFLNSYIVSGGTSCIDMWSNGVQKWAYQFGINCEGASLTSAFFLTGPDTAPVYTGFQWRGYSQAPVTFATDVGITSATLQNATINQDYPTANTALMFANPTLWTVSGVVNVQVGAEWNAPAVSNVRLTAGSNVALAGAGMPIDLVRTNPVLALSCARLLISTYTGPLCKFERTSDSTSIDVYPDSNGLFDRGAYQAFCTNTTCKLLTWYDQSVFANSCTQSTAANQATMQLALADLGFRDVPLWGAATNAIAIVCTAASGINDIFASASDGYVSMVVDQAADAGHNPNRLLSKASGSGGANPGLGWDFRVSPDATPTFTADAGATTSNGVWSTGVTVAHTGHVYSMEYNTGSNANSPTLMVDGVAQTITSTTAPVGTISTDAVQNLIVGNNAATTGNRGFPGSIAEVVAWKNVTPPAALAEAIRRNQAGFYGLTNVK